MIGITSVAPGVRSTLSQQARLAALGRLRDGQVHHVQSHESVLGVIERLWDGPYDREHEVGPRRHRGPVGLNDCVELDTPVAVVACPPDDYSPSARPTPRRRILGSTMKDAVARCAPRPPRLGPIFSVPTTESRARMTTVWPGGCSIHSTRASSLSKSSGYAYESPAVTTWSKIGQISGQSASDAGSMVSPTRTWCRMTRAGTARRGGEHVRGGIVPAGWRTLLNGFSSRGRAWRWSTLGLPVVAGW